ncbi:helix-turn-helix domain-containing protein [Kutzneria sp. 744]|uniref:winged helix-turn-helix transcriptional regulator n=1 Tax=Kutzneria sp. (strain 744) TaxID=345341 RepID=UPI0003EEB719|nr:helix-turn-helix domain-containing protein [Kutzneria sp. 744]EWM12456.1 transcriptional regulator [Kutzneria sp. 744]
MRADCPGRPVLDTVTSRWGVPILTALAERPHRFAELRDRMTGVSEKMLAQTLRGLAGNGFVLRTEAPTVPPQVTYSLTQLGRDLMPRLAELVTWIGHHAVDKDADHAR